MKKNKRIAIIGGAFNPPHMGHALVIETITRLFLCNEIWVMPSADRRDKKINVSGKQRLEMLKIMINDLFVNSAIPIRISTIELDRDKPTTTYETNQELTQRYPNNRFYYVIGSELVGDIEKKWYRGKELWSRLNFVVILRGLSKLPKKLPSQVMILDEDICLADVSSTFLRQLIKSGYSGLPYITKGVAEYIQKNKLYR